MSRQARESYTVNHYIYGGMGGGGGAGGEQGGSGGTGEGPRTSYDIRTEHLNLGIQIHAAGPEQQPNAEYLTDFRMIRLGDLNLLHRIGPEGEHGVVNRRTAVRRMYAARIYGSNSNMTVAMYEGDGAEEQCREEISRYLELRHPYLLQLFGVVRSRRQYAAVFHDDLIPHTEVVEKYRDSHFSTIFFWAAINTQLQEVRQYMRSLSGTEPSNSMYTVWIRPSTGRLCLDLMPPVSRYRYPAMFNTDYKTVFTSVLQPPGEAEIIASMSLSDYHDICDLMFSQWHNFFMSTDMTVRLCSVRRFAGSEYKDSLEIAFLPDCATDDDGWTTTRHFGGGWDRIDTDQEGTLMMRNGWIRINSANVVGEYQRRIYGELSDGQSWVGPANHIFNCLDITSNHADYLFIDYISYFLRLSDLADNLPAGYLMLCPLDELQSELPGAFRIPDCPAYWSLDPSGVERLSAEEARNQGFPDIDVGLEVFALSWDTTVYAGTRQFHEAKGFDPYSQDVAIALGHPLFQLSCEKDVLFAHMQESDKDNYYSDSGTSGNEEFYECDDQESDMDSFSDEDSGNFVDAEEMHEPSSESAIDEDVP